MSKNNKETLLAIAVALFIFSVVFGITIFAAKQYKKVQFDEQLKIYTSIAEDHRKMNELNYKRNIEMNKKLRETREKYEKLQKYID